MAARKKGSTAVKDGNPSGAAEREAIAAPSDFDSPHSFLASMRKTFYDDILYDQLNTDAGIEDLKFLVGQQWDDLVRQRREAARKPVLTVNRLPAFLAQVVGARLMNETVIKISPDNGGTEAVARVREGLIRNIQKQSKAELAYSTAFKNTVAAGIGNFQVEMDYESDDVFDQVIKVTAINDAFAVVWDRMLADPTGKDAGHVFVVDTMKRATFTKRWPWATASDLVVDYTTRQDVRANGWMAQDDVRVVSYWRMRTRKRTLAMLNDGTIQDVTDILDKEHAGFDEQIAAETLAKVIQRPDGTPVMREVDKRYAEMYLCSGLDILEGPYELPISRVPVFRVPGWEINIGDWKHRWGLIRFLKDPQRLHNFWRSVLAEKIMQTPRAVWTASETSVAGREQEWRESHLSDNPLLVWNSESGQEPKRVAPAQLENALVQESSLTTQDLKDVSNIHEANLGMPSNEVSGAAIVARQRVSDTGTVMYQHNLTGAIEEAGIVINELIPVCYDTARVIKVLGQDGAEDMQTINDGDNPNSVDLSVGRYGVTVKTGPSTATKRIEAAESMMTFINAAPQVAGYTLDLVAEAMDWPKHEEFARRIRMTLPPGMVNPKDMTPEMQQAAQATAQQQGEQAQMAFHQAMANYLKTQSEVSLNSARAQKFKLEGDAVPIQTMNSQVDTASKAAERESKAGFEAVKIADGTH